MKLSALGRLRLTGSGLTRPKPLLLLTYLALEGPKYRTNLAELFFPAARDPADALSTTFRRLRKIPGAIELRDDRLACPLPCDAKELLALLDAREYSRALDEYSAPFLDGFSATLPAELEEWVYATREFLGNRLRDGALLLAESALGEGDTELARLYAGKAFSLEGAAEPEADDLSRLYRLLSVSGDSRAPAVRSQAVQLGLDLDDTSDHAPGRGVVSVQAKLPVHFSPLVGRDLELVDIAKAIADPNCRLLTIHGPGGIGKTRLAVQAGYEHLRGQAAFGRVAFVSLEALTHPEQVPHAIASTLVLAPLTAADPWRGLADRLAHQSLLLILDNFEHLKSCSTRLSDLLANCPEVKLLVTSRERLNLSAEWVITLEGLPVPTDPASLAEAAAGDAVNLFVKRAKRTRLGFTLTEENLPQVLRICRLLSGLPLGIELAAAWVRVMPLEQLASLLEGDLATLENKVHDVTSRHHSLWAAFEHSWRLLTARERQVLRRLAVFRGGFRREAAAAVAGATIADLMSLVDKSLVRALPNGRFDRHALLSQFTLEKLAQDRAEESETLAKHGAYYTELLIATQAQSQGAAFPELFEILAEEESNLLAYLDWSVVNERSEELSLLSEPLLWYFPQRGRFRDGISVFGRAIERLPVTRPETKRALSGLLTGQAWLCRLTGEIEQTMAHASRAVELARAPGSQVELVRALDLLSQAIFFSGRYRESLSPAVEGLELARKSGGDPVRENRFLQSIAYAEGHLGDYDSALRHVQEAWSLYEEGLMPKSVDSISTLMCYGFTHICRGSWDEGRAYAEQGIRLSEESGYTGTIPLLKALRAHCLFELGRGQGDSRLLAEARRVSERALPMAKASGEHLSPALIGATLGRAALLEGRMAEAEKHFLSGVGPAWRTRNWLTLFWILPWLSQLYFHRREHDRAAALGGLMLKHHSCPAWGKRKAEEMRNDLCLFLDPRDVSAYFARGSESPVGTIMSDVVGLGNEFSQPT